MVRGKSKFVALPAPSGYLAWLTDVFGQPVTPNGWYFDLELTVSGIESQKQAEFVACMLENCGDDLARFSDAQVGYGLNYLFNNSCSDAVFALMDDSVPIQLRLRVIAGIKVLYRDCFSQRCVPVLGHLDEVGGSLLNQVCYMFWDVSPLSWWENRLDNQMFYRAVVDVLEEALTLPNPACVESALHGLGHMHECLKDRITSVIAAYQRVNVFVHPALQVYAQQASTGRIL